MAYIEITRYKETDSYEENGVKHYELIDPVNSEFRSNDIIYSVNNGDTLISISFDLYGDARYWWLLADFNKIFDPYEQLIAGTQLRAPSLKRIKEEIL